MSAERRIVIADPDPAWAHQFEELAGALKSALGPLALAIEHVGSTSVPGLPAKPILDIDVVIDSPDQLPAVAEALGTVGYRHIGDLGIAGREAFTGDGAKVPTDGKGTLWPAHNLYVCAQDSAELAKHLAFRNALRARPDVAQAYAHVKRDLADQFVDDVYAYAEAKGYFVEGVLRSAAEDAGSDRDADPGQMGPEIQAYYCRGREAARCQGGSGQLEFARIQELTRRFLPEPPAVVLDVGGGPATHAKWLAADGHEVHLIDPVEDLLEVARESSAAQPASPITSITLGEARALPYADGSADAVLLFGPLYHLTQRTARVEALREACRVLRSGGVVVAIGISRFSSALDGLLRRFIDDDAFIDMMTRDLAEGQHRRLAERATYFTTAYLHLPEELEAEANDAGLQAEETLAIQGPAWLLPDFEERWADEAHRARMMDILQRLEAEPSLLGASGHLASGTQTMTGRDRDHISDRR